MSDNEEEQFEGEENDDDDATMEEGEEEETPEGEEEEEEEGEEGGKRRRRRKKRGDGSDESMKDPETVLTEDMVADSLSLLCKTGDGLAHAYVKLDIHEKELTDISMLNSYIHLRLVDASKNNLKVINALSSLTHLLTLKVEHNKLTLATLDEMPYLQVASFANNRIKTLEGVNHPLLEHLNMNNNLITVAKGLDPDKLTRLHTLELRGNKLPTTAGIDLPCLKNLFLAANKIKTIEGLDALEHLATLHLRDNQLEKLDGFTDKLKNLQYINLRGNNISDIKELKKLECLPLLRAIVLAENTLAEEEEYRLEVLIALRRLERLDKDEYTEEERQEAQEQYEVRRQEALQAEEEEGEDGLQNDGGETEG